SGTIFFYVILLYMPTFARTSCICRWTSVFRAGHWSRMHDRAHSDIRRIVRSYRTQADYDWRFDIVFCFDLSAVLLDECQSILYQSVDHPGCIVLPDGRILWSIVDGIGRTISSTRTFDGARNRLQHGCHAIRRFCAVLRNLVDPENRPTGSAGILCDVRRGSRAISIAATEGTCPRRRFDRHGSRSRLELARLNQTDARQ